LNNKDYEFVVSTLNNQEISRYIFQEYTEEYHLYKNAGGYSYPHEVVVSILTDSNIMKDFIPRDKSH
jgi:hypothetical protein